MSTFHDWPHYKEAMAQPDSYVRILHAAPGSPSVDIYVNGNPVVRDLEYEQITEYVPVSPGNYSIQVFPAGQTSNPVISTGLTVPPEISLTLAAIGEPGNLSLFPIREVYMPVIDRRSAYVRFAHLSPDAPSVDVTLPDGTKLFSNISYMSFSDYISVAPGSYTLQVKPAGKEQVVLTVPNVYLAPGTISTVYAVGLADGEPPLEALLFPDGAY